jgi:hypothetical protein
VPLTDDKEEVLRPPHSTPSIELEKGHRFGKRSSSHEWHQSIDAAWLRTHTPPARAQIASPAASPKSSSASRHFWHHLNKPLIRPKRIFFSSSLFYTHNPNPIHQPAHTAATASSSRRRSPHPTMPPIAPTYTWSQDAGAVTLAIPLKGTKAALVDLFGILT